MSKARATHWLSPAARRALVLLAARWGVSQAAVLETLLRERAEREGLPWDQSE